jgi:chromate transport protein ChrA
MRSAGGRMAPRWASLMSGALIGWLVFLFSSFLLIIAASAAIYKLGMTVRFGSFFFVVEVLIAMILSFLLGFPLGKKAYRWLEHKNASSVYLLLSLLVLLSLLSFPLPFKFMAVQDLSQPPHLFTQGLQ